jgi:hypothetical protein
VTVAGWGWLVLQHVAEKKPPFESDKLAVQVSELQYPFFDLKIALIDRLLRIGSVSSPVLEAAIYCRIESKVC